MAIRGPKPKPKHLRLVDGTRNGTRHGSEAQLREDVEEAIAAFGPLVRPRGLKGHALSAWRRYIEPAGWLDASREPAAVAFCELWKEMRFQPANFPAAKHGQMRAYMADLGLSDQRNRGGASAPREKDEFFDD